MSFDLDTREFTLEEVCNIETGKLNANAAEPKGKYPFFTCSPETYRINEYAFDCKAILLAGNNAAGKFNVKYYNGKFNAYQRTYVITVKDTTILDYKYLYYLLNIKLNYLQELSIGSATKFLTLSILNKIKVSLPSIDRQVYIAGILSSLDNKIELNNAINKNLEEMAQALFKRWFVDFEFPNEYGEPYKSSGGEFEETELGLIPKGWKPGTISELGEIVGGATPSKKKEDYYTDRGIPWITPKDLSKTSNKYISRGEIDISQEGFNNSSVKLLPKFSSANWLYCNSKK